MYPVLNADKLDSDIEELVVLSNILPNDENANYNTALKLISQVNGKKITSLNSFVQTVEASKERYLNILFSDGRRVVLDKENAIKSDLETMKKYGITKKKYLE
jgi:23S rRNA-/tRNA-specific pseudouridylate synthase